MTPVAHDSLVRCPTDRSVFILRLIVALLWQTNRYLTFRRIPETVDIVSVYLRFRCRAASVL